MMMQSGDQNSGLFNHNSSEISTASELGAPQHQQIALDAWQYRITAAQHPGATRYGPVWLSHAPDLPLIQVVDGQGAAAGCLLGFPIDLVHDKVLTATWQLPGSIDITTDTGIAEALLCLGGRFLWLYQSPQHTRLYPDVATQISCVYDRQRQSAGATATAILDDAEYATHFDHALFATLGLGRRSWFTGGLTAHTGVQRLLPNHYLDLADWTPHRFDIRNALPQNPRPADIIEQLISSIVGQIKALKSAAKQPVIGLSGGVDSRVMLACARNWVDDIHFVTIAPENDNHQNTRIARHIAQKLTLRHLTLPRRTASRSEQERYLRRCGHCCADSNMQTHPSAAPLADKHVFISGFGADLSKAPYWYDEDTADSTVSPHMLLSRLGLPPTEKTMRHLAWWLDELDDTPTDQVLDLAYLELCLGPWAMAQYCAAPGLVRYAPLLTYENVALMFASPLDWKKSEALGQAIIGQLWPETLDIPIYHRGAPDITLPDGWLLGDRPKQTAGAVRI